MTDFNALP